MDLGICHAGSRWQTDQCATMPCSWAGNSLLQPRETWLPLLLGDAFSLRPSKNSSHSQMSKKKKNHVFCILQLLKVIGLFDALYTHLDNLETALKMDSNILIKRSNLVNFLDKEFKISFVSIKCM